MSVGRKLLIISGVGTVLLVVAIAAFSLGVYVGENGWTAGPPSMAGPGGRPQQPQGTGPGPGQPGQPGQPPGGGQPFGQPAGLPPGPPDLIGQVRSMGDGDIALSTPQGLRTVMVNDETEVKDVKSQAEASLADIQRGTHIAVFGQWEGDGRTLVAQTILLLPPPPKRQ